VAGVSVGVLWLVSRAGGLVAFALLTAALVAGVVARVPTMPSPAVDRRWPRWARQALHRDLALLAAGALVVHVASVVLDGYVDIGWVSAVVPFTAGYHPVAVAAGTVALDAVLVVVATSLLRVRLGYRSWRAVHWLVYAAWPLAALHYLYLGTDAGTWWGRSVAIGAGVAVLAAVALRLVAGGPPPAGPPATRPGRSRRVSVGGPAPGRRR
jgi:methionine sulfoxide reductase heme-binding subunit